MSKYNFHVDLQTINVEGIDQIPTHWMIKQVRYLLQDGANGIKIGPFGSALKLEDMVENGYSVYGQENVIQRNFDLGKRKISETKFKEMSVYRIFPEDILITMMGTSGKCEIVPQDINDGIIDSHLLRLRVKSNLIIPSYFKLLIDESPEVEYQIKVYGKGSIMHGLNSGIVKSLNLPIPSIHEQSLILKFLNYETAKIDSLIEKQKQLIQLLKEKRQAVISHAVTKGLDPSVKMKDSGVAWLGEVPEHWVVCAIKHIVSTPITDGPHETPNFIDEGVPFISAEAVSQGYINFDKKRACISERDHQRFGLKYIPKRHDVFMVKSGATTGVTAIVETDQVFNIWSPLAAIRCNKHSYPYFVLNFLRSKQFNEALETSWTFGTQQNIGMGILGNIRITQPPISEAIKIIDYLNQINKKYEVLISKAEIQIDILQERRTALISAAVTGKIDVRNCQNPIDAKTELSA